MIILIIIAECQHLYPISKLQWLYLKTHVQNIIPWRNLQINNY